jgi:hypothetical protein
MRSATGAHNHQLVGAPDQGAGSSGPETESLAVGRPLGSIQHGPQDSRGYWVVSGAKLQLMRGKISVWVKYLLPWYLRKNIHSIDKVSLSPSREKEVQVKTGTWLMHI